MNPNLCPDDTCHDIEIIVQLLLKIQIQTELNSSEASEGPIQVSHRIKDVSIIKIDPI